MPIRRPPASKLWSALLTDDPETISDPVARAFRSFAESLGNDLEALAAYMRSPRTPVNEAELRAVATPVLIVNGERDTVSGSPDALAAAIAGARLVKIPERDHLTVVPDQRFKGAVLEFLAEQASA